MRFGAKHCFADYLLNADIVQITFELTNSPFFPLDVGAFAIGTLELNAPPPPPTPGVPGPIVGAGLPGLVAGFGGFIG